MRNTVSFKLKKHENARDDIWFAQILKVLVFENFESYFNSMRNVVIIKII